jgi:hypothetical protein
MPLISYVKTATNKRLLIFESRGDSNQCTPCTENPDTHDTYTSHASSCMPCVCFLWAVHVRGNLPKAIISVRWTLLLPRKGLLTQPLAWLSDLQVHHLVSLLTQLLKQ